VEMETRCRILHYGGRLGEFSVMSSQSHVSHCRVLPLGEFTVTIPEPHVTLQSVRIPSAILKIVFRHILFFLKCSLGFDERRLSYRLRYTCSSFVIQCLQTFAINLGTNAFINVIFFCMGMFIICYKVDSLIPTT